MSDIIGKRYRTKIQDMEEDEEYGEVTHPIGGTFVVYRYSHMDDVGKGAGREPMYIVSWELAMDEAGRFVPATGMWTIWSKSEIEQYAVPV